MHIARDYTLISFPFLESTNDKAFELLDKRACHTKSIIIAKCQSKGKGQRGRVFHSPPGGLYCSFIFQPQLALDKISFITLTAGLACCDFIKQRYNVSATIKWPNDVYLNNKKVAGILTEGRITAGSIPHVVVGMGINLNSSIESFPDSLRNSLTSLYHATGQQADIYESLDTIAQHFDQLMETLADDRNHILSLFQHVDLLHGLQLLHTTTDGKSRQGIGRGIAPTGGYIIKFQDKEETVLAGDIKPLF